jgi:hypothetical protein
MSFLSNTSQESTILFNLYPDSKLITPLELRSLKINVTTDCSAPSAQAPKPQPITNSRYFSDTHSRNSSKQKQASWLKSWLDSWLRKRLQSSAAKHRQSCLRNSNLSLFPATATTNYESLPVSALSANFQNLTVVLRNLL